MTDNRSAAVDYLRHVLEMENLTPSSLAKLAGISSTTLTRPLNDDGHKFKISMGTLEKIAKATGYDPTPFIQMEMDTLTRTADMHVNPAYDREEYRTGPVVRGNTPIVGEVEMGKWFVGRFLSSKYSFGPLDLIHIDPEIQKRMVGVVVRGDHCDVIAVDGEIAVCILRNEKSEPLMPGHPVVVEREIKDLSLYEVSIRMPRLQEDGSLRLAVHSKDPSLHGYVVEGETEKEVVRVIADVDCIVRSAQDGRIYELEIGRFVREQRLAEHAAMLKARIAKLSETEN